jgi:lipopolysaccharide/colanic/teichoic acid biosynthesis glycosyltransferase
MLYPIAKRFLDTICATIGIVVLSPFGVLLALLIKLSDRGPVFYSQTRIGQFGKPFRIWKFRSMQVDAEKIGLPITKEEDPRITRIGRLLRKAKLDELPQLWNVVTGNMSLVGPRPEVPRYVAQYSIEQREVLNFRPGITDLATLLYRNEERMLRGVPDAERVYLEQIMPPKIDLSLAYARQAGLWEDTKVILRTLLPGIPFRLRAEKNAAGSGCPVCSSTH